METKGRVKEPYRGIVPLCKRHCIVCLLCHTHAHQVNQFSPFPPDMDNSHCLLLFLSFLLTFHSYRLLLLIYGLVHQSLNVFYLSSFIQFRGKSIKTR